MPNRLPFRELWVVDFEFIAGDGARPDPVCLVARELRSGRSMRVWRDELHRMQRPPYPVDDDALFIAYFASAELGCHLALDWPVPARVLDLYAEFRAASNGLSLPAGRGLLGALIAHGLDAMGVEEKVDMRELILRGAPWNGAEREAILDYCQADVDALTRLLTAMIPGIVSRQPDSMRALGHALLRGRYMAAVARMEYAGIPVDAPTLERLRRAWPELQLELVAAVDRGYGIYDGRTFKRDRFEAWLARNAIPWPRLETGTLALDDDTFREMARAYPAVAPLRELRHALSELRLNVLAVGRDGRNRCLLSPFGARSSRNTPSASRFMFGPSRWIRGLIKPARGRAIAYVDWSSQEIGIAAALSGDAAMLEAYRSGDPYLAFAIQAGLAPSGATKASHGAVRARCKACVLGIGYGMGERSLALRLGGTVAEARELMQRHREICRTFWWWAEANVDRAMLTNRLETVYGWPIHIGAESNPRALLNFPMQANGAEMMRLACSLATERGLMVCAPIHDALLLEAPVTDIETAVMALRACMAEASREVLDGFELRTDASVVRHPARYMDEGGAEMWQRVMRILAEVERGAA